MFYVLDRYLMLEINLPVVDKIHSQSNMCVTDVMVIQKRRTVLAFPYLRDVVYLKIVAY